MTRRASKATITSVFFVALCGLLSAAEPFVEKLDLFTAGDGGYKAYHIPGIVVTTKGTVLAWCEARLKGGDWDDIHILLRRSSDDGKTWSEPKSIVDMPGPKAKNPFSLRMKHVDPNDVTYNQGGKNLILFSNPHNLDKETGEAEPGKNRDRKNVSIKLSRDEAQTWPINKLIEDGPSMYSDIAVTPSGTILCFYGRSGVSKGGVAFAGGRLTLARFNLEWLRQP